MQHHVKACLKSPPDSSRGASSNRAKIYCKRIVRKIDLLVSLALIRDVFVLLLGYLEPKKYVPFGMTWR
jgi:hypothetical protein